MGEMVEGSAPCADNPGVPTVFIFVVLQMLPAGAFTVFVVVVAIDLLGRGESDGGHPPGCGRRGRTRRQRAVHNARRQPGDVRWLSIAVVLWGAPMAVMGLMPEYVVALLAAAVIGIGNAMVDVTVFTLVARMVPDAVLARVFGALESAGRVGRRTRLAGRPVARRGRRRSRRRWSPSVCSRRSCAVLTWYQCTKVDRSISVRTDVIDVLRGVPMLRPLPVNAIEQLAQNAVRTEVLAGATVFEAGDVGDRFYVVEEGERRHAGRREGRAHDGPGEGFGEIALLGNTTRTMTVRASEDTRLLGIGAADFLPAVTGISEARSAAEKARSEHLRHAPGRAADDPGPTD